MPRFLAPITVDNEFVTGNETISGNETILGVTSGKESYWSSVDVSGGLSAEYGTFTNNVSAAAFYGNGKHLTEVIASGGIATDSTKLPLSGGVLTNELIGTAGTFSISLSAPALSGTYYGDGTYLTGVIHTDDARLSNSRAPSGAASGDLSNTYPGPTVAKIQGNTISTQTPANGQVLQWNGTAWGPGSIPTGGSGGGGIVYFFNQAISAQPPTTNLPLSTHEMGRVALSGQTILTSNHLSQAVYDLVGGYVTDVLDPSVDYIPAGIWDFNIWGYSDANINNPTVLKALVYTYDEVNAPVLISTSPDVTLTDSGLFTQIQLSCLVPQTNVELTTRIYAEFRAKASAGSKTVTLGFGGITPTHTHTTIPSIGGSGLVKAIDGILQSPASLLVDVDVANNAAINQTKISGLTAALAGKVNTTDIIAISAGGTGKATASEALAALGAAFSTIVQTFSTVGTFTWTKPANAKTVHVLAIGGGGGGGGGARYNSGTACAGGGGGGGGGMWDGIIDASLISDTVSVTVGGGGTGGAGAVLIGAGIGGNSGTLSKFDNYVQVTGGVNGGGGNVTTSSGGAGGTYSGSTGGGGGLGATGAGGTQTNRGGSGGGGGGGVSITPAVFNGGVGGYGAAGLVAGGTSGGGSAAASGNPGGNGTYTGVIASSVSSAGGGGGSSTFSTGSGGNGGNGGGYGTGGGGGGATIGSGTGGSGGNGANGLVVVTTYF